MLLETTALYYSAKESTCIRNVSVLVKYWLNRFSFIVQEISISFPLIQQIIMTVIVLIYIMTITAGYTQRIISPQPGELQKFCPGEEVNITCETRGSSIIAWASNEYIEQGGTRLEFAVFNNVGDTHVSPVNPNTIATLIKNTNKDGVSVLVSQLCVRVLSQFLNSSVTCINVSFGTQNTTRLHVLGMFH